MQQLCMLKALKNTICLCRHGEDKPKNVSKASLT